MAGPRRATPSKRARRLAQEPPPRSPRAPRNGPDRALVAVVLIVVGGLAVAGLFGLMQGQRPAAGQSGAPLAAATDDTGDLPTDDLGTDVPQDSSAPVSPVLEARIPATVDDVSLTVQSAVDATNLSSGPDGRALNAAMVHLGKQASDLEIAIAYDETGSLDIQIIGFRANGVTATAMRDVVLSAWLSATTPGVTSTHLSWSGADVTKYSYGDQGPDEYVVIAGDSVFVVETSDATVAQEAGTAILGPAAPASPRASAG
jgi:hypothetical protein